MGAESFVHKVKAKTAEEGFRMLKEEATRYYGDRGYNGSISTCSMGRCKKRYDKQTKTTYKEVQEFIQSVDNGEKWVADYIDMGVAEYQVITLKKVNIPDAKPVIRLRFVVREQDYLGNGKIIKDFETKKEADDYALSLAIRNGRPYDIFKEGVLISGKDKVSTIEMEVKSYATKPKLKSMPNRKIVEIREFIFYGWASS